MSKSPIPTKDKLPPIHPGRVLLEDMKDEQISIQRGKGDPRTGKPMHGWGATLASAQYWLNIQNRFDLDSLDQAAIERDVSSKADPLNAGGARQLSRDSERQSLEEGVWGRNLVKVSPQLGRHQIQRRETEPTPLEPTPGIPL